MILVTGATGLTGSHLIEQLSQQGEPVRALYHHSTPSKKLAGVEWMKADILDVDDLNEAMQGITKVYHCAAMVSFNSKDRKLLHRVNIDGTTNVVNVCLDNNIEKLLFMSSVASLGRIREGQTVNEEMQWSEETGNSEYGKTKYLAEMEVWRGIGEGLNAVIVNPTIILGAGDWTKGSSAIFKSAYNEFPWYTEGVSGFVDVQDVVKAMIALMNSDIAAQRFILNGDNISYRTLFTKIAESFNKKPPHKNVTKPIAAIVWRIEAIKAKFTGKQPLLTKETAHTAQAKVYFDNNKLKNQLPSFEYKNIQQTIDRICIELKEKYQLK